MVGRRPFVALLGWLLAAGCALSAPPATDTLGAGIDPTALGTPDAAAQTALGAALARPDDPALALAASRALFAAADHRLQAAVVDWLTAHPGAGIAAVVVADDQLGSALREQVVSLCQQGLELAQQAAMREPTGAAKLQEALHLSMLAWANGATRALLAGFGPKLANAIAAAVAADEAVDGGGPLRLQGRFRSRAPWPYADLALAERSLRRAVELHSICIHWLFLGDVLWAADRRDEAQAAWQSAVNAGDDDSTRWVGDLLRRQAAARLRAAR
jgi:hypothetical protein